MVRARQAELTAALRPLWHVVVSRAGDVGACVEHTEDCVVDLRVGQFRLLAFKFDDPKERSRPVELGQLALALYVAGAVALALFLWQRWKCYSACGDMVGVWGPGPNCAPAVQEAYATQLQRLGYTFAALVCGGVALRSWVRFTQGHQRRRAAKAVSAATQQARGGAAAVPATRAPAHPRSSRRR